MRKSSQYLAVILSSNCVFLHTCDRVEHVQQTQQAIHTTMFNFIFMFYALLTNITFPVSHPSQYIPYIEYDKT
jgi:glutamyl-tRNA reductase